MRVYLDDRPVIDAWDKLPRAVAADRPAAYWRLGETTGGAAADSGPKAAGDAAFTGTATAVTWGQAGGLQRDPDTAAGFAAAAGSRVAAGNPMLGRTAAGVELWFKGTGSGVLFGTQNTAHGQAPTVYSPVLYVGTDGYLRGTLPGTNAEVLQSDRTVGDGAWHHAAILTGSDARQGLWLDGALVGQTAQPVTMMPATVFTLTRQPSSRRSAAMRGEPYFPLCAANSRRTATFSCSRRACRGEASPSRHL